MFSSARIPLQNGIVHQPAAVYATGMRMLTLSAAVLTFTIGSPFTRAEAPAAVDEGFMEILRVVEDKDGTANVRAGASLEAKVTGKVTSGAVVSAFSTKGDWTEIDTGGDHEADHFIHSSRLKKLVGWKQIAASKVSAPDEGTVSHAGAEVEVTAAPFVAKEHKITKTKDGPSLVDGRHPWGTDGGLPAKSLALTVKLAGSAVPIPVEATHDLFEPDMDSLVILTPGKPAAQMVVAMWNSDGAGGYLVAWSFVNGRYAGRSVMAP
jgi:hypothetical protein